ncbi:titin-like [Ostrinia nubilalis]|uniref:titin-like n=1 Tax=Ostrinia nubilalis TaxID=29057 RepID=UPI0030822F68
MDSNTSRTILYRNTKCCEECKDSTSVDLRKICQSEYKSAPTSYSQKTPKTKEQSLVTEELKRSNAKKVGTIVLSDSTKTRARRVEHTEECPYRRRCYQCRDLVVRIRSLLDEIKAIKKNKAAGVICDFCERLTPSGKCKRCEFLADRYKISETIDNDARQQRFKIWLCKVKQFLYTILERETCKHKVYPQSPATDELTHLLHELKSPLTIHEPDIGYFPSIDSLENITESKDILEQVLMRLKSDKKSEEFYNMQSSCICKYFADKKFEEKQPSEEEKEISTEKVVPRPTPQETKENVKVKKSKESKEPPKKPKEKPPKQEKAPPPKEEKKPKEAKPKEEKKVAKAEPRKPSVDAEADLMAQLMKKDTTRREVEKPAKAAPPPPIPKIKELPTPVRKIKEIIETVSESIAECDIEDGEVTEMVKGNKIVPIEPRKGLDTGSVQPLMFKVQPECPSLPGQHATPSTTTPSGITEKGKKVKEKVEVEDKSGKGVIRYMLSNREFIEKGWTLLPTTKIMRRMNIYKMVPANPKFDWFDRHRTQRLVYYDTGEKFAEIQEDGSGKWFYKSGMLALDYYCAQDSNSGHRYVVYSSGENKDAGRRLPVTVLASFDYLGNGVVYDHYGNERLKYNQSEGIVIDEKIGPPGRWKWHTLNEPPVLQPMFVDHRLKPSPCLEELLRGKKDEDPSKHKKEPNLDMLTIELENFLKEKAHKLLQEFKPFQIKMKALRVNDQFSLKVLDQANIYLLFREGQTSIKLNLGMLLISNEIVDTDTAEVSQVATPYDRHPPKSQSIADIQNALEKARKLGKARGKLRN